MRTRKLMTIKTMGISWVQLCVVQEEQFASRAEKAEHENGQDH
jgi:hypothetical protein